MHVIKAVPDIVTVT